MPETVSPRPAADVSRRARPPLSATLIGLAVVLVAVAFSSICLGRYAVSPSDLVAALGSSFGGSGAVDPAVSKVLWEVRLPRILGAALVGAALATAGAAFQGVFRNPMVSPDLLGASSGAAFGAAVGLLMSLPLLSVSVLAFMAGIAAVALAYAVSNSIGRGDSAVLLMVLTGIVVSGLFSAFTAIIKFVADPNNKLPAITFWLMGGLSNITNGQLALTAVPMALGFVPVLALRWRLNVLAFGDYEARALGVNAGALRLIFVFGATLMTAASVAISGMIGWVGLVIPHAARLLVGPNHRVLIPASSLLGAIFLIVVDDVARTAFTTDVPLGILTSIIGAPFFLLLLWHGRRPAR